MEVGELVGKAGAAAEELGLDLREIFEDPDKLQKYSQVTIAFLLAAVAWHRANSIKFTLYRVQHWIDEKGGVKGEGMKWYDWLSMLTSVGITMEAYAFIKGITAGQTGDFDKDVASYRDAMMAYYEANDKWHKDMAHLEAMLAKGTPGETVYEMNLKVYNELKAKQPVEPKRPYYLDATLEDRIIYCSVVFMLAMHPELIAEMVKGVGAVLQGLGEITPL